MNNQYDYGSRFDKLTKGIDTTFKNVLEPFIYDNISDYLKNSLQHQTELTYYHRRLTTYINAFLKYLELVKFEEVDFKKGYPTLLRTILENCKI